PFWQWGDVMALRRSDRFSLLALCLLLACPFTAAWLVRRQPPEAEALDDPEPPSTVPAPGQDDPLPPGATARMGTTRFRTGRYTNHTVLSPDGSLVAAGTYGIGSVIHVFDRATGCELRRFPAACHSALAFSPDGRALACAEERDHVELWDAATGTLLRRFE